MKQVMSSSPHVSPLIFTNCYISWILINLFFFEPICFLQLFFTFHLRLPFPFLSTRMLQLCFFSFLLYICSLRPPPLRLFNATLSLSLYTYLFILLLFPHLLVPSFSSACLKSISPWPSQPHALLYSFIHLSDDYSSLFCNFRICLLHYCLVLSHPVFGSPILLHYREVLQTLYWSFSVTVAEGIVMRARLSFNNATKM